MSTTTQLNQLNQRNPLNTQSSPNRQVVFDLVKLPSQLKEYESAQVLINDFNSNNEHSEYIDNSTVSYNKNEPKSVRDDLHKIMAKNPNLVPSIEYYIAYSLYLENNIPECVARLKNILTFANSIPEIRTLLVKVQYQQTK